MLSLRYHTDSELLLLLKEGDHAAFTEIYKRYSGLLYLHAYKRLKEREEARDIVQELFTLLWKKREEIHIHTGLAGYLYAAVRNRVIKAITRRETESGYYDSLRASIVRGVSVTDHLARERELAAIIEREIGELPAKMRRIFNLSRRSCLSHKEIAQQLQLSESTVKKQVNNALKVLRAKLETLLFLLTLLMIQ